MISKSLTHFSKGSGFLYGGASFSVIPQNKNAKQNPNAVALEESPHEFGRLNLKQYKGCNVYIRSTSTDVSPMLLPFIFSFISVLDSH